MINSQQLSKDTSKIVQEPVLAVGIFDASLSTGHKTRARAAVGIATYVGTKLVKKKLGLLAGVAGAVGGKKVETFLKTKNLQGKGLTPIMVCAITKDKIYLLAWEGNHRSGTVGPVLQEFSRDMAAVKNNRKGVVEIHQDVTKARIECNLGMGSSNKTMNKKVLKALKESSSRRLDKQ